MDSVCCNPIHVDDEQIDMDLEELWELQRKRSKGGRGTQSKSKGRLNLLNRSGRRGFSLTRNRAEEAPIKPTRNMSHRRTMSTGRPLNRVGSKEDRGRSRSPCGRNRSKDKNSNSNSNSNNNNNNNNSYSSSHNNRKVSINKFVERIDTKPIRPSSRARGRSSTIAAPIERKSRSRSWSIGRRRAKSERGIIKVRSRSQERKASSRRQVDEESIVERKRGGFFGGFRSDKRDDDDWSSSEDSYATKDAGWQGGFFAAFR